MLFEALCARKSRERTGRVLSGIYFGREFLSSSAAGWVRKQHPSRRSLVDFGCVSVRYHFATNSHQALKAGMETSEMFPYCC